MDYLKEEIRKILHDKIIIIFMIICTIFNISFIFVSSSKSGELKIMSENYNAQLGEEIFKNIDGSELGLAYYDERYKKSNLLVDLIHQKYEYLESSLELLSEEQADVSTYAGELTIYVHQLLFEYLTKILIVEGILLFTFITLENFFMEYYYKTANILYSSFRGRKMVFDKMFSVLIIGILYLAILTVLSYFTFFRLWDFEKIWEANIASSYNYINDYNDPIFMKPFITWTSFTVKEYFCASLVLMIGIWIAWWLFSTWVTLITKKINVAVCVLATYLIFPFFGLFLFTKKPELYFLNSWSITVVVYVNQMWFTDLGYYTLFPWQETLSVILHLLFGVITVFVMYRLFCRKDVC